MYAGVDRGNYAEDARVSAELIPLSDPALLGSRGILESCGVLMNGAPTRRS